MQRRFPTDDVLLHSGDIRDQVEEVVRNRAEILMFLGRQFFLGGGEGSPKFLTKFINLVTIEHVTKLGDDRPSDLGD